MNISSKIIERTAKLDAYPQILCAARNSDLDYLVKMLEYKVEGHSEFLREQEVYWSIAHQTFKANKQ